MDPFRNFVTNLNAPGRGPITVLIAWMFVVAARGIFGHGEIAGYAMELKWSFICILWRRDFQMVSTLISEFVLLPTH